MMCRRFRSVQCPVMGTLPADVWQFVFCCISCVQCPVVETWPETCQPGKNLPFASNGGFGRHVCTELAVCIHNRWRWEARRLHRAQLFVLSGTGIGMQLGTQQHDSNHNLIECTCSVRSVHLLRSVQSEQHNFAGYARAAQPANSKHRNRMHASV